MSNGMIIEATNSNGVISIKAGEGLERTYSWNDKKETVRLRARKERWYGSFGAYRPTGVENVHMVVEEGQQHFCSEQEAIEWLGWQNDRMQYVYTPDGLVVGWYTSEDPNSSWVALSVRVWQFYISGSKPRSLAGARSDHLRVKFQNEPSQLPKVGNFVPSKPQKINGRLYSGKAIDYMSEQAIDITPSLVEKTIAEGEKWQNGEYVNYNNAMSDYNFMWVELDKTGRVVLLGE